MKYKILSVAAMLGFVSVLMGALGDHYFEITPDRVASLETAIRYNMIYAVLSVALTLAPQDLKLYRSALAFLVGATLFSFSIYASIIFNIKEITYITPIGGMVLMGSWLYLAMQAFFIVKK